MTARSSGLATYVRDILNSRELMLNLAMREIKGKYKGTVFGQLWSLVNPLTLMLVYTFVFSFVFRVQPGVGTQSGLNSFPLWLLSGLLPWLFFARSLNAGAGSLVSNQGLIQKVYFARVVMPLADIFAVGYSWLFEMAVLLLALLVAGAKVWITLPYLVFALVTLFTFTAGLGLIFSLINVYFRDTEHLVSVALQLWLYLTPVVYPLSLVAGQSSAVGPLFGTSITLLDIYRLNPMCAYTELFRAALYDVAAPSLEVVIMCSVWSIATCFLGVVLFSRKDRFLAEAL